jgi:hypothetical protein
LLTNGRIRTGMVPEPGKDVDDVVLDLKSADSYVFQKMVVKKIPAEFILSEAISYQRPLADTAVCLSRLHDGGYLMVYPRPSRQAPIAR